MLDAWILQEIECGKRKGEGMVKGKSKGVEWGAIGKDFVLTFSR